MKKIVIVLIVLLALVAMPAAPGFAAPPQAVGSFRAHLSSSSGNYQGEAQFALTKCSSGLWYKVVLANVPAGVKPEIHLHILKGENKYLIGYLTPDSIPFQWDHYGFDGMLRSLNPLNLEPNLLEQEGVFPQDLYLNMDMEIDGEMVYFRPLKPLVEDYLIPGQAVVDVHFLAVDEKHPDLIGITSGQSNTVW